MKQQGSKLGTTDTSLRKMKYAHQESFEHFSHSIQEVLNVFSEDKL